MAMTSCWCRVGLVCVAMVALLLSHRLVVVDAFFTGLSGTSRLPPKMPRAVLEMRERKCDLTGKRRNGKAMAVSKSMRHTHRVQKVNLQWVKLWWEEGHKFVRLRVATKTMRTIHKKGLQAVAQDYDINLHRFAISSGDGPPSAPVETEAEAGESLKATKVRVKPQRPTVALSTV